MAISEGEMSRGAVYEQTLEVLVGRRDETEMGRFSSSFPNQNNETLCPSLLGDLRRT